METSIRRVPVSRAAAALRWKKNSGIYERIEALLRDEVAGDPMGGTRWTRKTTQSIARELIGAGIRVGASTVRRLLRKMDFSLKTNRKNIESGVRRKWGDRARRNRQFSFISVQRRRFESADLPIVSVDGKKRELVGNFKNTGRTWRHQARPVNDHDFPSDAIGVALPYGLYDVRRNTGLVAVGTSHETAAFAVDTVEHWWHEEGRKYYSGAKKLLILADGGGANSSRSTVWKCDLQQKLCNRYGLEVTVCHYPPGASKWNPIEHRMFSEISKQWQGVPLESYETVLKYIRRTKTKTGLSVAALLNSKNYPKGETATEKELDLLNIRRLTPHPEWNYTIKPQNQKQLQKM